jgi:hypothetical protein
VKAHLGAGHSRRLTNGGVELTKKPRRACSWPVVADLHHFDEEPDEGPHKIHTYKEYHSVCPLVGIGTLPPPLSPASLPLPPEPKGGAGGGHTRVRVRIRGSPNYNDRRKNLALCLLCVGPHQSEKPNPQRFCQGRFPRGAITFKIVRFLRPLDKRN